MINFSDLIQSSGWKNFMAKLYGLGAAVVIVGALFKIQHWPGAGMMLTVGLTVEAVIFFFSAFEPIHEEIDWTLVYPELAGMTDEEEIIKYKSHDYKDKEGASGGSGFAGSESALAKFDQMIEEAEITPELFKNLGKGIQKLNDTSSSINDLSNASAVTNEYVSNMKEASQSLGKFSDTNNKGQEELAESVNGLSESYKNSANSILEAGNEVSNIIKSKNEVLANAYNELANTMSTSTSKISEENNNYSSNLDNLNKNMAALNAAYQLQIHDNDEYIKNTKEIYKDFNEMMNTLKASVEETNKYKDELTSLQKNLSSLNNVYGNMLSAMHVHSNNNQ